MYNHSRTTISGLSHQGNPHWIQEMYFCVCSVLGVCGEKVHCNVSISLFINFFTAMMSLDQSMKVRHLKALSLFVFFFALACERIFIKMHSIESRCVTALKNILGTVYNNAPQVQSVLKNPVSASTNSCQRGGQL